MAATGAGARISPERALFAQTLQYTPHRTPDPRPAFTECGVTLAHADGEGVFLWAQLPDGLHVDAGILFSPSGGSQQHLHLHAAYASDPAVLACLREGLDALGERRLRLA